MTSPLVSICMPCYNAEPYVAAALDSALAQTWQPLEIIAVNDGSTDKTGEILDSYRDCGVKVIEQENAGAAAARNRAYSASCGEYVLFLDADDLIGTNHLEALVAVLRGGTQHIAMSQWDRFKFLPTESGFPSRPSYRDLPGPKWLTIDWISGEPMTQSGMFLIPRSLIEEAGGWNETLSLSDDFEFFARIISRCEGLRFAKDACLFYRSGLTDNLSGRKYRAAAESACRSLLLGTAHLLAIEDSPHTRHACANILQSFEYAFYPDFSDLRSEVRNHIAGLGGGDLKPSGPPGFQTLRRLLGWRAARHLQHAAERLAINTAARAARDGYPGT